MEIPSTGLPRPAVTIDDALGWAREHYGVEGEAVELGSQQDRNVLITTATGERLLLKVSNPAFAREEVEAQNLVMARLAAAGHPVPRPVAARDGADVVTVPVDGVPHHARLLTFVDGSPLIDLRPLGPGAFAQLGDVAGRVSAALADVDHPGLDRAALQWDLRRGEEVVRERLPLVRDPARRATVERALARVTRALRPLRDGLPVQALHADLTDDNVVAVRDDRGRLTVEGIIDFGDASRGWRVAELAVACTAVFHHEPTRPLAVLPLVRAFDAVVPLTDAELDALWPLIVLRGATLVVGGEEQVAVDPTNAYATDALEREWTIFAVPAAQDAAVMTAAIRAALGRPVAAPAVPSAVEPLAPGFVDDPPVLVDLSQASDALWDGAWLDDGPAAEERGLADAARAARAPAATRFGEARLTRAGTHARDEPDNVALACDVHAPAPLALLAPFGGELEVHGRTQVVRGEEATLVIEPLDDRPDPAAGAAGDGTRSASAGDAGSSAAPEAPEAREDASGAADEPLTIGWVIAGAPLLTAARFRVWLTAPGATRDGLPPRFVPAAQHAAWATRVLDPAPLLGLASPATGDAPAPAEELARRTAAYAPLQSHYYADPPQIERGWREHLIDTRGRHYLDMVNNVTVLGHGHPRVAQAAADQWRRLNTNSRFHYRAVTELSERLLATVPDELDTVLLVNSGSEAVDLALRLTRAFTGREDVLCVTESYHGWTVASDAVSTSTSDNPRAEETRPAWVHAVELPNAYRGTHRGPDAGPAYARDAIAELERLAAAGTPIGTWIAEPRNGNAGAIGLAPGYLSAVYDAVRAGGGVCVADEVQVGYGRQGAWFWGHEEHGVVPDVITVAKAMGDGHPLGAVITRAEIAQALADQGTFFSSAGGSTLSCRVGTTVLDVLRDERLQENAADVGEHLKARLEALAERQPLIGAVHGRGLYLGVELVRDRETLEPAREETAAVCDRLRDLGVIVQPTGDRQNVLKVKPPLCFTRESADFFVAMLDEALGAG